MADDKKPQGDTEARIAKLEAELAAARESNRSKDADLTRLQSDLAQARLGDAGNSYATTTTKPTSRFRVVPYNRALTQLVHLEGEFVDESEAIRCFWRLNNGKTGLNVAGKQMVLDSTNVNVQVECLDPKREERIRQQYKLPTTPQEAADKRMPALS